MSVTETLGALGEWGINLKADTPKAVLDKIIEFGHVVVDIGNPDPAFMDDGILRHARYVGQLRSIQFSPTQKTLSGPGMLAWAADSDNKGEIFETALVLTNKNFHDAVTLAMPASLTAGTIFNTVAGTISTTFLYQSKRDALDFITSTMGAEYRVNGDGSVDAGLQSDLYRIVPVCAIVKDQAGADLHMRALPGSFDTTSDVDDFTTRVVLLGQGENTETITTGTADINPALNPYKDMFGNPVKLVRMVSESGTESGAAATRAQLALSQFESTRDALTLSTSEYDIKGEVQVGDNIYVYDRDIGLFDNQNEVIFRGERMNPLTLRCTELTWPVIEGSQVLYRDGNGNWTDLTRYVLWETGATSVTVGGFDRTLTSTGETINNRPPTADTSTPDKVVMTPPFTQAVYQSPVTGATRAASQITWDEPHNVDGSVILDGDHYEIRYRQGTTPIFPSTWSQVAGSAWTLGGLGATWSQPLIYPQGPWQTLVVGWDELAVLIQELLPTHPYDVQVRAVDSANPPHFGEWSDLQVFQTSDDTIPPQTPAPPVCDASLIAVQVTHFLGASTGGSFNLDPDLHHLEVHAQYEPTFDPDDSTMLGKLPVNYGMISGEIPVVGTFQVNGTEELFFKVVAVDSAGNKSTPSVAVNATPDLIDDEHITNLTASKITAGTVTSNILLSGSIKTGITGARTEIDIHGIRGYATDGTLIFNQDDDEGKVSMSAGRAGSQRIDILADDGAGIPRIDMYDDATSTHVTQVFFGGTYLTQREDDVSRDVDGGFIQFQQGSSFYGHHTESSGFAQHMYWDEGNGGQRHQGKTVSSDSSGGQGQYFVQTVATPSGFTGQIIAYGATMVGSMSVQCTILDTSTTTVNANNLDTSTTTGCSVTWDITTHAITSFFNCWRIT